MYIHIYIIYIDYIILYSMLKFYINLFYIILILYLFFYINQSFNQN